ncbi:uncharacterized protein G2W53_026431 [Senna tora]|uniref:Uncharacterized protein n=1 Tax=Senna tora TaxID=362788 RepID=A0A834TH63_9FABA|nr:uncharacterized protein G2W53_026431 [Senna tora]
MLRHDPRSSHAMTTPIGTLNPLRFANTTRTSVFHSPAQQVFCLVIHEAFLDPTMISRSEYVKTSSTLLPCCGDSNWSIKTTPNMLRHDTRSSHAMTTAIGASNPLRFANTTRSDMFHSLAQQTRNRGRILETFTNLEAKALLRKNLHELRGKRLVAQVSETRRFSLYLRTRVELMLELESPWHGRSVDHVLTYSGHEIAVGSQKPSRITRQKTCCGDEKSRSDLRNLHEFRGKRLVAQGSETRRFALYLRNRVELMLELESSWRRRSVDHVLTYSEREIAVGSQNPSRITMQKTCCAIVMAWEERGSCLNIFRTRNCGRILETFMNYEAKDLLRKNLDELRGKTLLAEVSETRRFALYLRSRGELMLELESLWRGRNVDHVLTYSGRQIAVRSQKLHELRGKRLVVQVSQTRRFALYLRSRVELMLELVSSWHGRSVDHFLTYSGRKIAVESQKPS